MTYRPAGAVAFGPPLRERLPALAYLAFALVVSGLIVYGQNAPSGSRIFHYVVEGDRHRVISSSVCGLILFLSAVAAVIRTQMRGVIVHPDGIEMRELLTLGWPRVRRLHWSQIDRLFVPAANPARGDVRSPPPATGAGIRLDLWDGSRTRLPDVAATMDLAVLLEKVALARAIPIEGGTGLLDDLGNPLGDDAADPA